ncbi:30S ribosomal protein S12 methylthiotransferase RimO [Tessaracoccus oleiagri]|uniref:Ribosomal protein uS12 methylthiotransferase RimO n=1 Tax=Tessaracoccus oleiagri TaxID=686624 RepID=A0A1G9L6N1_9ACTN|nr:30S ribosomal protein S12 methylthiotransferase RimO [Tessaracoccus oleiagri]SDL57620.1 ribosomal protein S12 methylthiotransferase RimO [Tessaracoccus oleiagri]
MTLRSVHIASLGCARNDVDSEELAARLEAGGFRLVDDAAAAETVVVNTCGFVEQAKKDSIDTLLAAADLKAGGTVKSVVAVGCMAERYGVELARELPEADAVLGFDAYRDIASRLTGILDGVQHTSHVPRDRRTLLPIAPAERTRAASDVAVPGHDWLAQRRRLTDAPWSSLKIASGCDRRCAFCAIPSFRGSYLSRPSDEVVAEARWLADQGVRELFLVSENTSSYGKDRGVDERLETLLPKLAAVDGIEWIRVSYLQPAEVRPSMLHALLNTEKVVPYFDLSFQHASKDVLRRMRRFGDPENFLGLIGRIREQAPTAGIRSNVIAGFPGETEADVEILRQFIVDASLDVLGVFGYSDEEGTEGATLDGHVDPSEVEARRAMLADLSLEVSEARAADRIGEDLEVLVEGLEGGLATGRAAHQGPETDGSVTLDGEFPVGSFVRALAVDAEGIDLIAEAA